VEDAGHTLDQLAGTEAAVFVGMSSYEYPGMQVSYNDRSPIDVYTNTGGALSIAANRISYSFNLKGASAAVDTACSSALVAVHLACENIWHHGAPFALAGGVNVLLEPDGFIGFSRLSMLSPEGRCKAFAAGRHGLGRRRGAGLVPPQAAAAGAGRGRPRLRRDPLHGGQPGRPHQRHDGAQPVVPGGVVADRLPPGGGPPRGHPVRRG